MGWIFINIDLIFGIIGSFLIAFSFGSNPGKAHQVVRNLITKKKREVYLGSLLHPLLFRIGCGCLIIGFILASLRR